VNRERPRWELTKELLKFTRRHDVQHTCPAGD
jgi:hypothetical protein